MSNTPKGSKRTTKAATKTVAVEKPKKAETVKVEKPTKTKTTEFEKPAVAAGEKPKRKSEIT